MTGSSAVTRPLAGRWTSIPPVTADVDVGLAIGRDQDLVAFQVLAQDLAQRLRYPADLRLVARAALGLEIPHQGFQVPRDRAQLARLGLGRKRKRLAADQRLDARHPAAPGKLRDHHGDQRDHRADRGKQVEDVLLGVGAAPLDETHVVDDQQPLPGAALAVSQRRRRDQGGPGAGPRPAPPHRATGGRGPPTAGRGGAPPGPGFGGGGAQHPGGKGGPPGGTSRPHSARPRAGPPRARSGWGLGGRSLHRVGDPGVRRAGGTPRVWTICEGQPVESSGTRPR